MKLLLYNDGIAVLFKKNHAISVFYPPRDEKFTMDSLSEFIKRFNLVRNAWEETDCGYKCKVSFAQ